jgi:hypothetical protein
MWQRLETSKSPALWAPPFKGGRGSILLLKEVPRNEAEDFQLKIK